LTDIAKGEKITAEKITAKRSDEGLELDHRNSIIGRTANRDIKKDDGITLEKVV